MSTTLPPDSSSPSSSPSPDSASDPPRYPTVQFQNVVSMMRGVDSLPHPTHIGPYHIEQLVGEGGMGTVYRAQQTDPIRRVVAIKVIKFGMDTAEVIARFESERQALAQMNHPNIARVLDAGATEFGRPFFVMEFVDGESITTFADRQRLTVSQRLELFEQACAAVQHAHQKAIIHRDLKPSNILVTIEDNQPRVKVIDFGVAKAIEQTRSERTLFTETGRLVGTPEYMSPEQAGAADSGSNSGPDSGSNSGPDIDTRSDVYSLGVVLYELLSGALPFDPPSLRGAGYAEIQRIIRDVDPPTPSTKLSSLGVEAAEVARLRKTPLTTLEKQLRSELEWIPLKAMRKDRGLRYATPAELAEDVANYLNGRPLRAGPISRAYLFRKFLRRNKGLVAAMFAVLLTLSGGIVATTWQARRAENQRRLAEAERATADKERATAEAERDNATAVLKFFTDDVLGQADPSESRGRDITVKQAVDKSAADVGKSFGKTPLIEASIRLAVSSVYRTLGQYDQAADHAKHAYELRRTALGDENFDTIAALSRYANVLLEQEKPADALPIFQKVIAAVTKLKGADDSETLTAASGLATVYNELGRYADAEPLLRRRYEVYVKRFGANSVDTLDAQSNYGAILFQLGRRDEAAVLLRQAYDGRVKVLGGDDPMTLESAGALASVLVESGKLDEALPLFKGIVETQRRVLGENHPETLRLEAQYADTLAKAAHHDEAIALLKSSAERQSVAIGADNAQTLTTMNLYANALSDAGHHDLAEPIFRKVLETRRKVLGDSHPNTLISLLNLAAELRKAGRAAEGDPISAEAVEKTSRILGPTNPATIAAKIFRAGILLDLHRPAEAEPLARDAFEADRATLGIDHPSTRRVATLLAKILTALGRSIEAATLPVSPATTTASR